MRETADRVWILDDNYIISISHHHFHMKDQYTPDSIVSAKYTGLIMTLGLLEN